MTEPTEIVDDRAARLARLQARRGASSSTTATASSPAGQPTTPNPESVSLPADTTASIERTAPIDPSPKSSRRRSPATNAKIVTIGASTTALLGMMAGYGISDGLTIESTGTAASTLPVPVATAPPQVIVIMVDAETGRPISTSTGNGEGVLDSALGSAGARPSATQPATPAAQPAQPAAPVAPAAPAPVAAPAAVDLAVPAAPQPAPAPASQPAPQPQASSGGS